MSQVKAVLFDLDGVLIDACDWHYEALNIAIEEEIQWNIDRNLHLRKYNGLPTRTKLKMLMNQGILTEEQADIVFWRKQQLTEQMIRDKSTIDESKTELLEFLKNNGISIACVTNCIRRTAEDMLVGAGLYGLIDILVSNEDVDKPKPSPEGYLKAMAELRVTPSDCLIVEDSPKGLDAAWASEAAYVVPVDNATQVDIDLLDEYII